MNINIQDLPAYVQTVAASVARQQTYVELLAQMYQDGARQVKLFDDANNIWVYVPIEPYWQIHQNLLLEQMAFNTSLSTAQTAGQVAVNTALEGVKEPIGITTTPVVAQAKAAKKTK